MDPAGLRRRFGSELSTNRAPSRADRHRRFVRVRAILAGGLVLGIGAAATVAAWTDEEHASATLTAGTFSIVGATDGATFTDHPTAPGATLAFAVSPSAMVPGAVVYALYSVKTTPTSVAGTLQLTADAANGSGLGAYLTYGVTAIAGTICSVATFAGGTSIVAPGSVPTVSAAATQAVAAAGASVVNFCFAVTLPSSAVNAAQGTTVTLHYTFGAVAS
ncbi:SipW-dependent-type signal peptide-containing protein [Cryobacterium sp. PH31-L1]|uniref:SipW-dependent-type signal peptide-containing protein n=1 Tax=Cryobacterium sp. PH31-L1 TaxID=3046199 RepID=UPI0024BBD900|nr:SipW-dependent-type signal peptide-containing protein [Cryobacterium sp. PH31-L1]MDJ0376919.1 SipW-dependent-type signal peptide-containing protein [Cryobacterium sp. PH31-L1]